MQNHRDDVAAARCGARFEHEADGETVDAARDEGVEEVVGLEIHVCAKDFEHRLINCLAFCNLVHEFENHRFVAPCRLEDEGENLISSGYDVSVKFDDSIIQDKDADINRGVMLVGAGLKSKKKFLTDEMGYTPEEADQEIAQIAAEKKNDTGTVSRLFGGME